MYCMPGRVLCGRATVMVMGGGDGRGGARLSNWLRQFPLHSSYTHETLAHTLANFFLVIRIVSLSPRQISQRIGKSCSAPSSSTDNDVFTVSNAMTRGYMSGALQEKYDDQIRTCISVELVEIQHPAMQTTVLSKTNKLKCWTRHSQGQQWARASAVVAHGYMNVGAGEVLPHNWHRPSGRQPPMLSSHATAQAR